MQFDPERVVADEQVQPLFFLFLHNSATHTLNPNPPTQLLGLTSRLTTSKCELQIIQSHLMNLLSNPRLYLWDLTVRQVLVSNNRLHKIESGRGWHCWQRRSKSPEANPLPRINSGSIRLVTFGNGSSWKMELVTGRASRSRDSRKRVIERGHGLLSNGVPVWNWVGVSGGWGWERWGYRGTIGNSQRRERRRNCRAQIATGIGWISAGIETAWAWIGRRRRTGLVGWDWTRI